MKSLCSITLKSLKGSYHFWVEQRPQQNLKMVVKQTTRMASNHEPITTQRPQDAVNGYIRQIRSRFPQNISYYNTPLLINKCLQFYYDGELFTKHGKNMQLSYTKDIVSMKGSYSEYNNVYGKILMILVMIMYINGV